MANTDGDGAQAAAKAKKKKLILIGGAAVVALALVGGGAFLFLGGGGEHGGAEEAGHGESGGHGEAAEGGHGAATPAAASTTFIELPEMTINLATTDPDKQNYVRMTVAIEVADSKVGDAIKPLMPRVIDSFQTHLREMRPADLRGSSGVYRLKEELLRRVNLAIAPAKADAVLFKDIVVQ
ncbi:hypothetical protein GCM10008171_29910 [Methylopila jiangsuensis]|uniref:Flagellar protein FliL n=1 Tax=Methylopila jiangsuensis TaxID=586230 RepID=A0A9W6JIN7_9HYPH|nr:flagellar basal body-associated FliL family protein [Methylopila jiangsuensis]MDR6284872.1 flagellar FliL protein [Methylopila jiangsuensis]GLK77737.1 hypothetical protein GCM10008171_29910 [Methylopila jiangsuensis]